MKVWARRIDDGESDDFFEDVSLVLFEHQPGEEVRLLPVDGGQNVLVLNRSVYAAFQAEREVDTDYCDGDDE